MTSAAVLRSSPAPRSSTRTTSTSSSRSRRRAPAKAPRGRPDGHWAVRPPAPTRTPEVHMSTTQQKPLLGAPAEDSNRVQLGFLNRMLARPEIGALVAAIVIGIFFLIVAPPFRSAESLATVLYQSATIGIVAVAVGMLMIGGEFDLSAGVMVTTAGLFNAMFSYQYNVNLWVGAAVSLLFALILGFLNGFLVMKTGIASFLITLGTFFVLQGANLGLTKVITGSVSTPNINQMNGYTSLEKVFASTFTVGSVHISIIVVWWFLFVAIASWVLLRTKIGNWIYAVGGNQASARAVGVPVVKVKIGLFMTVSFLAWFMGMHTLFHFNTIQAGNGIGNEFLYIIAAVVGGTLLTGGYGNAIGAAIGSFIFGMTSLCIVYAGWDPNWFRAFLGVMLLLAVLVNLYVKRLSTTRKVG